jgi:hypothetical protein
VSSRGPRAGILVVEIVEPGKGYICVETIAAHAKGTATVKPLRSDEADLFPHIVTVSTALGDEPHLVGTGLQVWPLIKAHRDWVRM